MITIRDKDYSPGDFVPNRVWLKKMRGLLSHCPTHSSWNKALLFLCMSWTKFSLVAAVDDLIRIHPRGLCKLAFWVSIAHLGPRVDLSPSFCAQCCKEIHGSSPHASAFSRIDPKRRLVLHFACVKILSLSGTFLGQYSYSGGLSSVSNLYKPFSLPIWVIGV
jgi:hypothetical protein